MYIPAAAESQVASFKGHGDSLKNGGWSSLIGVVTAICGNILISFALNTQRYAHLRLGREREARLQEKRKQTRQVSQHTKYGTEEQSQAAEVRAKQNAKDETNGYTLERPEDSSETQPLIPKIHARKESGSSSGADSEDDDDDDIKEKSYLRSPIWWLGIAMMVFGETGNFLAYGFAPASIVSPLGVVALISNCLIAPLLLKEKFRIRDGLGVLIAVAGCVVVVLSASSSNPKLTPEAIWDLVTTWEFETYLGITIALIIALVVASNKFGEKTILIDIGLVGLFGGYTALSTKGVASLLTYKIWRVITFPITYLLLAVLVFTAVMQIKYVNRALQRFNSTMVIPTQFVMFTISVIIGSAVLYRDFERESPEDAGKFVGGCALTFFGVWCITSGRTTDQDEHDEDDVEGNAVSLVDEEGIMPEIHERDGPDRNTSIVAESLKAASLNRSQTADVGSLPRVQVRAPTFGTTPPGVRELNEHLPEMTPGVASAVHESSAAALHGDGQNTSPQKPVMHATTSAPIVPQTSGASTLRPKTPLSRAPSGPPERPSPSRPSVSRGQTAEPGGSSRLLEKRSVLNLGPLTSPLSGSLAAIVADEIRKSPLGTMKRRKSQRPARRPTDQNDENRPIVSSSLKRHSIASGEIDSDSEAAADLRLAAGSPPSGRVRSLSATLGDMFGSSSNTLKRQRTLERDRKRSVDPTVQGPGSEGR